MYQRNPWNLEFVFIGILEKIISDISFPSKHKRQFDSKK